MNLSAYLGRLEMAVTDWCWAAERSTQSCPEQEEKAEIPATIWKRWS